MKVFWALVRNELAAGAEKSLLSNPRRKIYLGAALLLIVFIYTFVILKGDMQPENLLWVIPWIAFAGFGMTFGVIYRELGKHAGWWLSLPYSRQLLVGAKWAAMFLRFGRIILFAFLATLLLSCEACLVKPNLFHPQSVLDMLRAGSILYAALLFLFPLIIIIAIYMSILQNSRIKALGPLFWVAGYALFSFLIWKYTLYKLFYTGTSISHPLSLLPTSTILTFIPGIIVIAGLFYLASAYIPDHKVEV